ncbi:MAG: cytidylate kinase family protein [Anaerovoracaceae bacterium]|jgi:drug/metabolite transporter (DMT)-like permease/cytidylate kinase
MKSRAGSICILITAFAFGTMEISLKIAGGAFSSFQLTFLRFMIGGLMLLPFAASEIRRRKLRLNKTDLLYLLILGIINICFSMILFQIGVQMSNAGLAAIVMSSNPIFTMIFSHFIVHDYFNRQKAITLVLSVTGLLIVANPLSFVHGGGSVGLLIVLVAAIGFAFYTTLGKIRMERLGGMIENSFSFIMGSLVLLVINLIRHEPVFGGINSHTIFPLLYAGVVVTGIGYMCYMKAIELTGPSNASVAFFVKPVVALIGAAIVLGEPITPNAVIGMIFIILGCTAAGPIDRYLSKRKAEKQEEEMPAVPVSEAHSGVPAVITISREFGSGGRDIGKIIAEKLHMKYYDTNIIEMLAQQSGFSPDFIKEYEQGLGSSGSKILFGIYDQYVNYASDEKSPVNRLFQEECKFIKNIASEQPCVIVGRLANYILRDRADVFNVFITADISWEADRVMKRDGIPRENAVKKIRRINRQRRNHCSYFTDTGWGDAENYDLTVKSSRYGIESSSDIILKAVSATEA